MTNTLLNNVKLEPAVYRAFVEAEIKTKIAEALLIKSQHGIYPMLNSKVIEITKASLTGNVTEKTFNKAYGAAIVSIGYKVSYYESYMGRYF